MTTQIAKPSFDTTYEDWRPRLYRALVLATGDRDASLDAVDHAFARSAWSIRRGGGAPPAEALGSARRRLTRQRRHYAGFHLPDEQPGPETLAVLSALRSLDLEERLVVIAARYLGWDAATIGRGMGMLPAEAAQRARVGTQRVITMVGVADESTVDRALEDAASRTVVPLSRLETVKRTARWRRVGAVGAVALAGGAVWLAVGAVAAGSGPDEDPAPAAATGVDIASAGSLASLEWNRAVLPVQEGELTTVGAGVHTYLALLTDYSSGSPIPQVVSSANGLDWDVVGDLPIDQQGGWISQLAFDDGRWVAVGNDIDPASGRERPMVLLSDDGLDWTQADIPAEEELVVGDHTVTVGTSLTSAVVDDEGITVFGTRWADLEPIVRDLLPDDVPVGAGWGFNPDGSLAVFADDGTIVESFDAEELGIPAEAAAAASGNGLVVLRSIDDGATWDSVAPDGTAPGWPNAIAWVGDDLIAAIGVANGTALYRLDGDEWARVDFGGGTQASLATFDGRVYVAGQDAGGTGAIWRSADGETWTPVDLPTVDGVHFQAITASPHGLVAVGGPGTVLGPAEVVVDDFTVSISSGGLYTVTDSDGTVVAEAAQEDLEPGTTIDIVGEGGEVVVTIEQRAIDAAWEQVYRDADGAAAELPGASTVVASVDGDTWERLPLEEVLPPGFYPTHQMVGPGGILLSGWAEERGFPVIEGGGGQQLWVGTAG